MERNHTRNFLEVKVGKFSMKMSDKPDKWFVPVSWGAVIAANIFAVAALLNAVRGFLH